MTMLEKGRGAAMRGSKYHEAWYEPRHAELFDGWSKLSSRRLRKVYESFNEVRLLIENQRSIAILFLDEAASHPKRSSDIKNKSKGQRNKCLRSREVMPVAMQ